MIHAVAGYGGNGVAFQRSGACPRWRSCLCSGWLLCGIRFVEKAGVSLIMEVVQVSSTAWMHTNTLSRSCSCSLVSPRLHMHAGPQVCAARLKRTAMTLQLPVPQPGSSAHAPGAGGTGGGAALALQTPVAGLRGVLLPGAWTESFLS